MLKKIVIAGKKVVDMRDAECILREVWLMGGFWKRRENKLRPL
jgi:hypothetical protein